MSSLRERRAEQTRSDLVEAAFALFADRPYAGVSMEEIARQAGISRSTAYRRFPTKEDVVLEVPRRWLGAFDDAASDLAESASLADALAATCGAVARHIDQNAEIVKAAYAVLEQAPTLKVSGVATESWRRRMCELIDRHGDVDDETAQVLAGAYLGGIDAIMFHWVASGSRGSVVDATERVLELLRPILP